ncbi:MAG TPA: sigma-70 family RNA polymerase sigma factor [Chthonomonadaceae bacterium]|nr:sigma-70 family RNA polymerase sigma factor [Chthonomonadaceae bacterium]
METAEIRGEHKTEARLIIACQQGDRAAFRQLYETYKDRVYSFAVYALHGDRATAEDVTQEVFVRLFSAIGQFRHEANFSTWLYRLVANACTDELRKRKRLIPLQALGEEGGVSSEPDPYARLEISQAVQAALAELSPELRIPVLLKYFDELSYEEMATVLECPKGTIASRLNRGLKFLAQRLAPTCGRTAPERK